MWYWVKVKKVEWTVGRSVALVHLVPNFDLFFCGFACRARGAGEGGVDGRTTRLLCHTAVLVCIALILKLRDLEVE